MPIPSSPSTIQRPDLGFIVEEYSEQVAMNEFVATDIMPLFNTATESGQWPVIRIEEQLRRINTRRAIGAAYAQDDYTYDFDSFQVQEYGAESPVYVEEAKIYKRHIQPEALAAQRAVVNLWRDFEFLMAADCHNPDNVGSTIAATAPWTDNVAAKIQEDIKAAKILMRYGDESNNILGAGIRPNLLIITEDVFLELMLSKELKASIKDTNNTYEIGGMEAKLSTLAQHLGIDKVKIAYPLLNVAPRGAKQQLRNLWPNNTALLLKASNGGMDMREPAFGRTPYWSNDSIVGVEQYYKDENRKTMYRARVQLDRKVTYAGAMCHITGIAG